MCSLNKHPVVVYVQVQVRRVPVQFSLQLGVAENRTSLSEYLQNSATRLADAFQRNVTAVFTQLSNKKNETSQRMDKLQQTMVRSDMHDVIDQRCCCL